MCIQSLEELMKQEHPPVWSDFSMEVVNKTILMDEIDFYKTDIVN